MIFDVFFYDKKGNLIYNSKNRAKTNVSSENDDYIKLIYGLTHSLQNIVQKLSNNSFLSNFITDKYKLHFYESMTSIKIIVLSTLDFENIKVEKLYEIYVETLISKLPFNQESQEIFKAKVDNFIKQFS